MKNKLTIIFSTTILAIISEISLAAPDIANANTNTNKIARSKSVELAPEKTLLAQGRCQINSFETQVFQLTNQVRQRYRLRPLRWNCRLIAAAQNHSRDMARTKRLSHRGSDGSTMAIRARRVGYRYSYLAENVAAGQRSPQSVVDSWMKSSGHRKNILNPNVTEIGVGYSSVSRDRYGTYWTQVFGSSR